MLRRSCKRAIGRGHDKASFARRQAAARPVQRAATMMINNPSFLASKSNVSVHPSTPSWMRATRKALLSALLLGSLGILIGCAATPACRKGPKGDVALGARTAGEAVKTGAETGVEGVKTAGRAVGGWVEGGSKEAKEEWNKGKQETKETAHEGAADVDREASVPTCKD